MMIKAVISAYVVAVLISLCSRLGYTPHNRVGVIQQLQHPVAGIAMRQGRRFAMEDRTAVMTSEVPESHLCGNLTYTYAAVYDGHDGCAACDMLQQQLHPLVQAAVATSWQSSCDLHSQQLQADITAAAHKLNEAFLQNASKHANQAACVKHFNNTGGGNSDPAACAAPTVSSNNSDLQTSQRHVSSQPTTATADGNDGSTALFAVLAGSQLLIGNVGNSRAILCSAHHQYSNSNSSSLSHTSHRKSTFMVPGSKSAEPQDQQSVAAASSAEICSTCSGKDVIPYERTSQQADLFADGVLTSRLPSRVSSNNFSAGGTCSARSGFPYDPPDQPLQAILLSNDHTPARADEAARIAAAGGQVFTNPATPSGKPRVKGELEVTRSFGDLGFQDQGVVATPEYNSVELSPGDAFLVLASDGVFEALSPKEVCQHAWGVWGKSSSIATALRPPPALALSGQVAAAGSQPQEATGNAQDRPAEGVAAGIIGCCDCTSQQRIREAADAAQVDFGVLLRHKRRKCLHRRHRNDALQVGESADEEETATLGLADADTRSVAATAAPGSQQSQLQQHMQPQQGVSNCAAEEHNRRTQQQQADTDSKQKQGELQVEEGDMVCQTSGGSEPQKCRLKVQEPDGATCENLEEESASADDVAVGDDDEDCSADPTYSYCRAPNGIPAPYSLPQAIALRIVGEAYNRMSMDNLAVVVLDVRQLAAATVAGKPQTQQPMWMGRLYGGWGALQRWVSQLMKTIAGFFTSHFQRHLCRKRIDHSGDVAAIAGGVLPALVQPSALVHAEGSLADGDSNDGGLSQTVDEADYESLQSLGVSLLTCGWRSKVDSRVKGLQDDLPQKPEHVQQPNPQLTADSQQLAPQDINAGVLLGAILEASSQWRDHTETLSAGATAGTSITCDASAEAAWLEDPPETDVFALPEAHEYLLLRRIGPAMHVEADHLHMHPFLGDETHPAPYAMLHASDAASSLEQDPSLSLASHLQLKSLLPNGVGPLAALTDASAAKSQDSRTKQDMSDFLRQSLLDPGVPQPRSTRSQSQEHAAGSPASSIQHLDVASQHSSDRCGFAAAGLVGHSADLDMNRDSVIPGGLSAVMAALAAVPLEYHPAADSSLNGAALTQDGLTKDQPLQHEPQVAFGDADSRLIEPFWGQKPRHSGDREVWQLGVVSHDQPFGGMSSAAAVSQQPKQFAGKPRQWFKAGLLMLAVRQPGRTLLGWRPSLRGSIQQSQQQKRLEPGDFPHSDSQESVDGTGQQHEHALQIAAGVAVEDGLLGSAGSRYRLGKQAGRGHFGEVWLASRVAVQQNPHLRSQNAASGSATGDSARDAGHQSDESGDALVIKRTLASRGVHVKQSALREAYFGQLLKDVAEKLRKEVAEHTQQHPAEDSIQSDSGQAGGPLQSSALLLGHAHLVRYVESFKVPPGDDVWLVFQHEGRSLHSLLYEPVSLATNDQDDNTDQPSSQSSDASPPSQPSGGLSIVGPSQWWSDVRTSPSGELFVASIMEQLLQALTAVHAANITHRDVKPENMLVKSRLKVLDAHAVDPSPLSLHVKLIDFGSAVDQPSIEAGLFGKAGSGVAGGGPSVDELTMEYAPPEVLFSSRYHHPLSAGVSQLHAYDIWSAGVVMLELVLGTPAVFNPSPATRAAIDKQLHLQGKPSAERHLLYMLRGLMELCVYPPRDSFPTGTSSQQRAKPDKGTGSNPQHKTSPGDPAALPIPWSCSDEALLRLISSKDPTGVGLEGALGIRLVQRMLAWNPKQRPTAAQALHHAYFQAARHAVETGSLLFQSTYYQDLMLQCSKLHVGELGWC